MTMMPPEVVVEEMSVSPLPGNWLCSIRVGVKPLAARSVTSSGKSDPLDASAEGDFDGVLLSGVRGGGGGVYDFLGVVEGIERHCRGVYHTCKYEQDNLIKHLKI